MRNLLPTQMPTIAYQNLTDAINRLFYGGQEESVQENLKSGTALPINTSLASEQQIASRAAYLQKKLPLPDFSSTLKGDIDFAAEYYDWGFNLPYKSHESANLFAAAALSALSLPAFTAKSVSSFVHEVLEHSKEDSKEFVFPQSKIAQLGKTLKYITVGLSLGGVKGIQAIVFDTLKAFSYMETALQKQLYGTKRASCVLIDIQNDFFDAGRVTLVDPLDPAKMKENEYTKGSLAIQNALKILELTNELLTAKKDDVLVLASQDFHPKNHGSFASQHGKDPFTMVKLNGLDQMAWPDHCVQGEKGTELVEGLRTDLIDTVTTKGEYERVDSYSALYDNGRLRRTKMGTHLKAEQIDILFIWGLATDYCVKFSAEDALKDGFEVVMVTDAMRGIAPEALQETRAHLEKLSKEAGTPITFLTKEEVLTQYPEYFSTSA